MTFRAVTARHGIDPAMGALPVAMDPDQLFGLTAKQATRVCLDAGFGALVLIGIKGDFGVRVKVYGGTAHADKLTSFVAG